MNPETLGERIKLLRGVCTQGDFAIKIGINKTLLSKYERDVTAPGSGLLVQLRQKTGVDLNWLLTGEEPMFSGMGTMPLNGAILQEALTLVEEWLADNHRIMAPAQKAEVVAEVYAMALEGDQKKAPMNKERMGRILRLVS